jgi:hypothetical protein
MAHEFVGSKLVREKAEENRRYRATAAFWNKASRILKEYGKPLNAAKCQTMADRCLRSAEEKGGV